MKIPTKKVKNGFEMPIYGFGTWQMGGRYERDIGNDDEADIKAIQTAIELGVTHFDTAELYANGYSETLLGKAIKGYDRSKLFIASKVYGTNLRPTDLKKSLEASLERVGTGYFDLYMPHYYNEEVLISDTIKALSTAVDQGLIRHIGVSNFRVDHMQAAQAVSNHPIVANQVHYNLLVREIEKEGILNYCQNNDILLTAWRPLQKSAILGVNQPDIILSMMKKYQTTAAQIYINWLISQPNVIILSKTRSLNHLQENLGALEWQMEPEDIELLRTDYPHQLDKSDAVPLR